MTVGWFKTFIQHPDERDDPAVRQRYGLLSGLVGIILNLLLSAGKFLAGVFTGSIAVTADAFNNLSDAGSSVVTLAGFRLAAKQADDDHPFGHGRIEYISGLIVAGAILLVGIELARSSLGENIPPRGGRFLLALSWHSLRLYPSKTVDVSFQPQTGPAHRVSRHGGHCGRLPF